jgi:hypothetical protein
LRPREFENIDPQQKQRQARQERARHHEQNERNHMKTTIAPDQLMDEQCKGNAECPVRENMERREWPGRREDRDYGIKARYDQSAGQPEENSGGSEPDSGEHGSTPRYDSAHRCRINTFGDLHVRGKSNGKKNRTHDGFGVAAPQARFGQISFVDESLPGFHVLGLFCVSNNTRLGVNSWIFLNLRLRFEDTRQL